MSSANPGASSVMRRPHHPNRIIARYNSRPFAPDSATVGTIVVFTGILRVCQDEEGLASVLGHGASRELFLRVISG